MGGGAVVLTPKQDAGQVKLRCQPGRPAPLLGPRGPEDGHTGGHGFLILFIEEKKRREKIDSLPLLRRRALVPPRGLEGCVLHPGGRRAGGWLAASRGMWASKKRCQAAASRLVLLQQLR